MISQRSQDPTVTGNSFCLGWTKVAESHIYRVCGVCLPQDPVHTHALIAFTVLTFQHRGQEHEASTRDSFLGREQEKNYNLWVDKYKQQTH